MQENTNPIDETLQDTQADTLAEPVEAEGGDRVAALEAELAELKDQFLRTRAEMENLRRRSAEEVMNAQKYAINKFAQELLAVKDSLEMALADQSGQFDALKFGVDLTLKQLASAFEKAQIVELNPVGEKLDPHKHQAISAEPSDAEPNTVVRVMQKGYLVAERVLRPAMVVVSKGQE
ncbi:molecular chaperone GrpE [Crenobacter luteus]|uniref:nucleotide exchange factor GrpE n=1 Tax=Crenobacter luteus TaxID=1452487 RepID=UPI001050ED48|nr:nucleotide exchange factor GrpE [Crenobacter luteus]TCP15496.1 molecular chaperone GrpE [Crenobacter luteus]